MFLKVRYILSWDFHSNTELRNVSVWEIDPVPCQTSICMFAHHVCKIPRLKEVTPPTSRKISQMTFPPSLLALRSSWYLSLLASPGKLFCSIPHYAKVTFCLIWAKESSLISSVNVNGMHIAGQGCPGCWGAAGNETQLPLHGACRSSWGDRQQLRE